MENRAIAGLSLVAALLASGAARGQLTPEIVRIETPRTELERGKSARAKVVLEVADGFHIQANPAGEPALVATTLEVEPSPGLEAGTPVYPEGVPHKLAASEKEIPTYSGRVEILLPLTAAPDARRKKERLAATLRYQACTVKSCYFPARKDFEIPVGIR